MQSVRGNVTKTTGKQSLGEYQVGEMIHADLIGKMYNNYALVCIDHASKFIFSYLLDRKSEASLKTIEILKKFNNILSLHEKSVCFLRADNEFDTHILNNFCRSEGIILELTAPHSSYQNGTGENANKILKNKIRILLLESGLPKSFWIYAYKHALFLLNYLPRNKEEESPWKKLTGRDKNISDLLPFGCLAFYYNYVNDQKIFTKDKSGVFIGYDNSSQIAVIYDVQENKTIRTSAFQGMKKIFPLRKANWYEESSTGDNEKRETDNYFGNGDMFNDPSDNDEPISSSHIGTYGGSFISDIGVGPPPGPPPVSSSPPVTRSDTLKDISSMDKELDINSGSEYLDNSESDTMEIDENSMESNESQEQNNRKSITIEEVPDEETDFPTGTENTKPQETITPPKTRLMITNTEDDDNDNFIDASESFDLSTPTSLIAKEYMNLTKLHTEHTDKIVNHYSQILKDTRDLIHMKQHQPMLYNQRPIHIPEESGILPTSTQRTTSFPKLPAPKSRPLLTAVASSNDDLIPTSLPSPSPVSPTPTHTSPAYKRTDLNMAHIGPAKRRIQEGNALTLTQTTPEGKTAPVSQITSKKYIDLHRTDRNNTPDSLRSSFYKHDSSSMHLKGGETQHSLTNTDNDGERIMVDSDEVHVIVEKVKYTIPNTYQEAMRTPQHKLWKEAAAKEFKSMVDKKVYKLTDKNLIPRNALIVKSRWVFNVKIDNKTKQEEFKARIVAKGFTQERGINYVDKYAPVMRFETLRLVLNLSALNNWKMIQLDAKNAFLHGKLDYEVYLEPPVGTTNGINKVWKLQKSLYGLKQAPRIWYLTVAKVLLDNGFQNSLIEPCLFWKRNCLLLLYVDDILIAGKDKKTRDNAANILKRYFTMKELGAPKIFLGITISELANNKGYKISMRDTIDRIEKDYNVTTTQRKLGTPIAKGFDKNTIQSLKLNETSHKQYRSIIGTLLFLANTTRPDISFAVSYLSRFLENPTEYHMKGAKRTLQYLIQTKDFGITYTNDEYKLKYEDLRYIDKSEDVILKDYPNESKYKLVVITDSDWAGDTSDRKSQSGNMVLLNGNIIDWTSRKQQSVSGSSTESEYVALSEGMKDGLSFKNLLSEMKIKINFIDAASDNCSALTLAAHNTLHKRTKHIDIKYHYIRSLVDNKTVKLNYINTKVNIADILTKFLDTTTFEELIKIINKKSTKEHEGK